MVLDAVYKQDFLDYSDGFRSGRSAHQAPRVVQNQKVKVTGRRVFEVAIRNFLGTLSHGHLRNNVLGLMVCYFFTARDCHRSPCRSHGTIMLTVTVTL
jgi:hypothetical protein